MAIALGISAWALALFCYAIGISSTALDTQAATREPSVLQSLYYEAVISASADLISWLWAAEIEDRGSFPLYLSLCIGQYPYSWGATPLGRAFYPTHVT